MIPRRTFIKICGIHDAATAVLAAEAGADAIGVVFAPGSPRIITLEVARQIARAVPRAVQRVGLFVDAPIPYVRTIAVEIGLSVVQLHGRESARDIAALAPLPVWKAVGLSTGDPGTALAPWRKRPENLAALLLDVAGPGDAPAGGTGRLLDWNALTEIRANGLFDGLPPLVLAGGLTPHNVGQAVRLLRPWGVDVSSGVERRRGEKDATLIREFCQAVQAADAAS